MDILSLNTYVKFNSSIDLYNLIDSTLVYRDDVNYSTIEIEIWHEMRIDLIFQSMYNLEPNEVAIYLENIDIILYINNIDNALNIKKGMILKYPPLEDFSKFRVLDDLNSSTKGDIKDKLVLPNKNTRKDNNREKFKNNNYSLPPVVLNNPKPSVVLSNGQFSIGGL